MIRKKLENLKGKVVSVFSTGSLDDFVNDVLRDDERIRRKVISNPGYRDLLKDSVRELHEKYKGPLYWGKIIDKWDRVTSTVGGLAELIPGAGNAFSTLEEIPELIPKGIYAAYYVKKTGDWKAIPYWAAAEAASFIPWVGDLIDWTNIYMDRAKKKTKELVKKRFWDVVEKGKRPPAIRPRLAPA